MRQASMTRKTKETQIDMTLKLEGTGLFEGSSGLAFFDHMLTLLAKHAGFDLSLKAKGDLAVDGHHTVEDVGLVLGQLLRKALADKRGIGRYGHILLPMDEALLMCAVDLSGRPFLHYDLGPLAEKVGDFDTELTEEFMRALSTAGAFNLHLVKMHGRNSHHIIEGAFKALARSLAQATALGEKTDIPSSKGTLA